MITTDEQIERILMYAIICYKNVQIKFKKQNKISDAEQEIKYIFPDFKKLIMNIVEIENEKLDKEAQDYHNTILKLEDLIRELRQENEHLRVGEARALMKAKKYRQALEEKIHEVLK